MLYLLGVDSCGCYVTWGEGEGVGVIGWRSRPCPFFVGTCVLAYLWQVDRLTGILCNVILLNTVSKILCKNMPKICNIRKSKNP